MSEHARHLVIRASAGSGKTFQLTNRYLSQLMAGTRVDEILATTFTRKAAGEILERVMTRLAKGASSDSEALRLSGELQLTTVTAEDFRDALVRLVRSLHRLRVGTLDSFFAQLATNFTLELGLPPGWAIVDGHRDRSLREQAVGTVLSDQHPADIVRLTNLLAKGHARRSVSGLIRDTINAFYDVYLNTDAAAWDSFPEVHRLTDEQLEEVLADIQSTELPKNKNGTVPKTFESARNSDLSRVRSQDWTGLSRQGISSKVFAGEETYDRKGIPQEMLAAYRRLLKHVRAVVVQELAQQTRATRELLERFDQEYQRLKFEQRGVMFDDVTQRLRGLFGTLDLEALAYRFDGSVGHLLLDEFQDTSVPQWDVLRPFAEQITSCGSAGSFFCVGDTKQAIYNWRGGVAEILDALLIELPDLKAQPLDESHRSSQPVIKFVNTLFQGLTQHDGFDDADRDVIHQWCAEFPKHTTAKRDLPGYACVMTAGNQESGNEDEESVDLLESAVQCVADIVERASDVTVGVLVRKNDEVSQIMNLLRQRHIPASEEGGNPITDSAAVSVILSLLKLADHPGDTTCRFHVATSPLGQIMDYPSHIDDVAAAQLAADVRRSLADDGYGPTIARWCRELQAPATLRDRLRMSQLVELADRFDAAPTLHPVDFVRYVEQERFVDPSTDRVQVMTIHKAKGLQFDAVVAPLTESKLIGQNPEYVTSRSGPTEPIDCVSLYRSKELRQLLPPELQRVFTLARQREVRECLCRMYVTVTRPKHALYLVVPPSKETERSLPKSPAGLVRAALTHDQRLSAKTIAFEVGSRDWMRQRAESTISAAPRVASEEQPCGDVTSQPVQVRLADMPAGRVRGLNRMAPSQHAERHLIRLSDLLSAQNDEALNLGSLIHHWIEQIEWLDDGRPSKDELTTLAQRRGFPASVILEASQLFDGMISRPAFTELLSRDRYARSEGFPWDETAGLGQEADVWKPVVRRELSLAVRMGGELMTGAIDRLVLLHQKEQVVAAEVIDFKTDRLDVHDEGALRSRIAHYAGQLRSYGEAVSLTFGLPPDHISLQLAFVRGGVVSQVPWN